MRLSKNYTKAFEHRGEEIWVSNKVEDGKSHYIVRHPDFADRGFNTVDEAVEAIDSYLDSLRR